LAVLFWQEKDGQREAEAREWEETAAAGSPDMEWRGIGEEQQGRDWGE
jgi:hypothetical protein